jgi:hypothetical protein
MSSVEEVAEYGARLINWRNWGGSADFGVI